MTLLAGGSPDGVGLRGAGICRVPAPGGDGCAGPGERRGRRPPFLLPRRRPGRALPVVLGRLWAAGTGGGAEAGGLLRERSGSGGAEVEA